MTEMMQAVTVRAERLKVGRIVIVPITVAVVNIKLTGMLRDEPTPLARRLEVLSIRCALTT